MRKIIFYILTFATIIFSIYYFLILNKGYCIMLDNPDKDRTNILNDQCIDAGTCDTAWQDSVQSTQITLENNNGEKDQ